MIEKINKWLVIPTFLLVCLALGLVLVGDNQPVGTDVYNTRFPHGLNVTGDGCYAVDGSCVIDSSGNYDGAITASTITASGAVDFDSTLNVDGKSVLANTEIGGGCYATTSDVATAQTATQAIMLAYNCIEILANKGAFTLTLPATSTMTTLLASVGDSKDWLIQNATSSTGITLTVAKGDGIDLIGLDTNEDVIDPSEWAYLKCWRQTDTDVTCYIKELGHAD